MAVSSEVQEQRSDALLAVALGALLALPFVGDLLGIFSVALPLYVKTFLKSENRGLDFLIGTGLIALFFPGSYIWIYFLGGSGFLCWALIFVTRFLLVAKALPWYYRRLGGMTIRDSFSAES